MKQLQRPKASRSSCCSAGLAAHGLAWAVAGSLLGASLTVQAASDERAQLAQQRRQLSAAFAEEERACGQRFAVTSCVDDVRSRRREALAPLREREIQIDEAARQQRAAERRSAIEARREAATARPAASAAPPQLRVRAPAHAASRAAPRTPDDSTDERAAQAELRQRQAHQRREEAKAAQQRVQRRLEDRATGARQAAPLPVPPPASAPRP